VLTSRPRLRKTALTAHVVASVGWLGAVIAFLALSVLGLASNDPEVVQSAYITMEAAGWWVLVPLSVASLVTGLIQSLGTRWGLFRHYWVITKLVINLVSTAVLLLYMRSLESFADIARASPSAADLDELRDPSPLVHSVAALVLLTLAAVLSIFKPRGVTRYGRRHAA
jgi:hypothetical protein